MVAKGACGSNSGSTSGNSGCDAPLLSIQEKVSRNKRKFRADTPLPDLNVLPRAQANCPGYEFFPTHNPMLDTGIEQQPSVCELCRTLAYDPEKEIDLNEFQDADWSDFSETQLEELLLNNLDTIYKGAIKRIASYGYSEGAVLNAILSSGLCYGCKDVGSNIVDNALTYLKSGKEVDSSQKENFSEDLRRLEKSVIADMVNVLRDVRPFFSVGDAMWCLLVSDMNVSLACAMEDPFGSLGGDGVASVSAPIARSVPEPLVNSPAIPEFESPSICKLNNSFTNPQINQQQLEGDTNGSISIKDRLKDQSSTSASTMMEKLASLSLTQSAVKMTVLANSAAKHNSGKEGMSNSTVSNCTLSEQKLVSGRKGAHVGNSKREAILRQKSLHLEKNYRAFGSKAISRAAKHGGLGGLLLDKKCKPLPDANGINLKSASLKISKAKSQVDATLNLSFSDGTSASSSYSVGGGGNSSTLLQVTDTELSLSLPSVSNTGDICLKPETNIESTNLGSYDSYLSSNICGHWVPQDKKDEMLVKLVPRLHEMQTHLQDWTDWAQQKVMQAARRLGKDKAELQSLRQDKEEVASLRKEKQALEESTMKKLSDLENALSKASSQVEKANSAMHRLGVENSLLRQEMGAAKLRAVESAANFEEVSLRETNTRKKFQSWEKQKAFLQEELANGKQKLSHLEQQLKQEHEHLAQVGARWKQEETLKDEALAQAASLRKKREQVEASAKSKDDTVKLQALNDSQKYADDIRQLEQQIAQLRILTDSPKIAALKWAPDGARPAAVSAGFVNDRLAGGGGGGEPEDTVPRERECVMCLTEEMQVVFLPCAHQVVCKECNVLHEGKGLQNCPSCRSPIQRRIHVLFADS